MAHTAWEMVTSRQRLTPSENNEAADKNDISFTPLAVPLISGPGAIGVVISLSTHANLWSDYLGCILGILLMGLSLYLFLVLGEPLIEKFGTTGMGAINRVLGFLILAIAVQFIADGTFDLLKVAAPKIFQ